MLLKPTSAALHAKLARYNLRAVLADPNGRRVVAKAIRLIRNTEGREEARQFWALLNIEACMGI